MRDLTEVMCIIDSSGSMETIKSAVITNFNNFLTDQKNQPGAARFSLVTFNTEITNLYDFMEIGAIPPLNSEDYICDNWTALYDAIGSSIDRMGKHLASLDESERPNKVIVVILTDGAENASREFSKEQVSEMIKHQTEVYSWQFVFLAANQDACLAAKNLNISTNNAMYFSSSESSTNATFDNLSSYLSRSRSMTDAEYVGSLSNAFLDSEKDARD